MTERAQKTGNLIAAIGLAIALLIQTAVFSFWLGRLDSRVSNTENGVKVLLDLHIQKTDGRK